MTLTIAETIVLNRERQRRLLKARREGKTLSEVAREEEEQRLRGKLVNDLAPKLADTLSRRTPVPREAPSEETTLLPQVSPTEENGEEETREVPSPKGEGGIVTAGPGDGEEGKPAPDGDPPAGVIPDYLHNELKVLEEKMERLVREVALLRRLLEGIIIERRVETALASGERKSARGKEEIEGSTRGELVEQTG